MKALVRIGVVATAVACLCWFAWQDGKEPTPESAGAQVASSPAPLRADVASHAGRVAVQPAGRMASAGGPSIKLVAELLAARDWRAFAIAARSRPEEGGYFYAMHVTNLCGMGVAAMSHLASSAVGHAVAKASTVSAAQIAMTEAFAGRCAAFAANEAADIYQAVRQVAADRRDPIVNAVEGVSSSLQQRDVQATKAALFTLMGLEDPLALYKDRLMARVMSAGPAAKQAGALWFSGTLYGADEPNSRAVMDLALTMAACANAAPCELDAQMMLACLGGQFCSADRQAYLRHQFVVALGWGDEQFGRAAPLAAQIQDAVARRQVDGFVQ